MPSRMPLKLHFASESLLAWTLITDETSLIRTCLDLQLGVLAEMLLNIVEALLANFVLVSLHVLLQLRFLSECSSTSLRLAFERPFSLVDCHRVSDQSRLLAEGFPAFVALVGSNAQVDGSIVTRKTHEELLANLTFLGAFDGGSVSLQVSIELASDLELLAAGVAAIRLALSLVNSLVLGEISGGVVSPRALVAKKVPGVDVMGFVVLEIVGT